MTSFECESCSVFFSVPQDNAENVSKCPCCGSTRVDKYNFRKTAKSGGI